MDDDFLPNDFEDDLTIDRTEEFFIQPNLDSPLTSKLVTLVVTNGRVRPHEYQDVVDFESVTGVPRRKWNANIHTYIKRFFLTYTRLNPNGNPLMTLAYRDAIKKMLVGPLKDLPINKSDFPIDDFLLKMSHFNEWLNSLNVSRVRHNFNRKNRLCKGIMTKELKCNREAVITVHLGQDLILIQDCSDLYIMDQNGFSMICDVVRCRYNIFIYQTIRNHLQFEIQLKIEDLRSIFEAADTLTEKCGNEGVVLLKFWEPIVNGIINTFSSLDIVDKYEFLSQMESDFLEKCAEEGVASDGEYLLRELKRVGTTIPILTELHGLSKALGHPFVYVELAIERNRALACPRKTINPALVNSIKAEMTQCIAEGHYKKYGSWPRVDYSRLLYPADKYHSVPSTCRGFCSEADRMRSSPILTAITNREPVDQELPSYNPDDWSKIVFLQNSNEWENLNQLTISKDKACSPDMDVLVRSIREQRPVNWKERRVLAQLLMRPTEPPKEFIRKVDEEGLDKNCKMIGLCPKEREMNKVPRNFSIMPMDLKKYFGYGEEIVSKTFVPLFEECTMKDDLLKLNQKFVKNVVSPTMKDRHVLINISLDFVKWNMTFRKCNTEPFFEVLDDYCGFCSYFRRSHTIFEEILFYFDDYYDRLELNEEGDIKEGFYAWKGQQGGCEGLRQKPWTLITICMLRFVLRRRNNVEFGIMGQGDNQVICLKVIIPNGKRIVDIEDEDKEEVRKIVSDVMENLYLVAEGMGMPLKREETFMSHSFFTYGKTMFFDGVAQGSSFKRIMRSFPYPNEEYPLLSTALSSTSTIALAAVAQSNSPIIPFIFQTMKIYEIVDHHITHGILNSSGIRGVFNQASKHRSIFFSSIQQFASSIVKPKSKRRTLLHSALALGGNVLGGSQASCFYEFFLRGSADPLSLQLTYFNDLIKSDNYSKTDIERGIIRCLLKPVYDDFGSASNLLDDPVSLNLITGSSTIGKMKREAREVLESDNIKNQSIKEALSIGASQEDEINEFLLSVRPLYAPVLADIKKGTLPGLFSSFEGRFDSTKTIIKMARENGSDFLSQLRYSDGDSLLGWLYQYTTKGSQEKFNCPSVYAQILRDESWSLAFGTSVEIKGVTCPHPFHLFKLVNFTNSCPQCPFDQTRIDMYYSKKSSEESITLYSENGKFPPYLGSGTKEKVIVKAWETKKVPLQVKSAAKNLRLVGWGIEKGSYLAKFIEDAFHCFTDAEADQFETKEGYATGGIDHRMNNEYQNKQGMLPTLMTCATHCSVNTNNMGIYSRGSGNVPIHFQAAAICNIVADTTNRFFRKRIQGSVTHLHLNCRDCLVSLDGDKMESARAPPDQTPLSRESIFFASEESLHAITSKRSAEMPASTDIEALKSRSSRQTIRESYVAREIANTIMSGQPGQKGPSLNWLFDVRIINLMKLVKYYCCMIRFAAELNQDRTKSIKRTKEISGLTIYNDTSMYLKELDNTSFTCLTNIFMEKDYYIALASNATFSNMYPPGFPPTRNALSEFIKDVLISLNDVPYTELVFLTGECTKPNFFLARVAEIIFSRLDLAKIKLHNGGYSFINHCNSEIQRTSRFLGVIRYKDILSILSKYEIFDKDAKYYELYTRSSGEMSNWLLAGFSNIEFYDLGPDYFVKGLRQEIESPKYSKRKIPPSKCYASVTLVEDNKYSMGRLEIVKEHQGCADEMRLLNTTKGIILYSMTGSIPPLSEKVWMIADGAGGTSLALSSVFYKSTFLIFPYTSESEGFYAAFDAKPPEICRFNPGANVQVLQTPIDIGMSPSKKMLDHWVSAEDTVFLDLDAIVEPNLWIKNFSDGAIGSRHLLLVSGYSEDSSYNIIGWLKESFDLKVVKSCVKDSMAFLIDYTPHKQLETICFCHVKPLILPHDEVSITTLEQILVPNWEGYKSAIGGDLSVFRIDEDQSSVLECIMNNFDRFFRNPQSEKATRTYAKTRVNYKNIQLVSLIVQYLSQCGTDRVLDIDNYSACIKHKRYKERLEGETEFTLIKGRIPKTSGTSVYYISNPDKSWRSRILYMKVKSFCDSLTFNHQNCKGNCKKQSILIERKKQLSRKGSNIAPFGIKLNL